MGDTGDPIAYEGERTCVPRAEMRRGEVGRLSRGFVFHCVGRHANQESRIGEKDHWIEAVFFFPLCRRSDSSESS